MASNNIEKIKTGSNGTEYPVGLRNIYINDKNNLCIETSTDLGNTPPINSKVKGKINLEAISDILFKPGDDIILYSHHRPSGKQNEISIKAVLSVIPSGATKEEDIPVKLLVNVANLTLTTKDKDLTKTCKTLTSTTNGNVAAAGVSKDSTLSENEILDININTGKDGSGENTKGYLKVRARAIDLRCEEHGGIALLPKGCDNQNHMNKIKFEHGGGDGLEFGTFNAEKTSIFTDLYRFNKDGIWYMATRTKEVSDKYKTDDETTHYKYKKSTSGKFANDDFYDDVDESDEVCDTNALIKTANAFNYGKNRHAKITSAGNLEIQTNGVYTFLLSTDNNTTDIALITDLGFDEIDLNSTYSENDLKTAISSFTTEQKALFVNGTVFADGYKLVYTASPKIKIVSGDDIELNTSKDIVLSTGKGTTDYLNISDCPNIYAEYKISKRGAIQGSDPIFISTITNNIKDNENTYEGDIATNMTQEAYNAAKLGPETGTISCHLSDIIKLVTYMKTNHLGPWYE